MKKFLTQFFMFVLILLIFSYIFDIFISNNLKKSNSFAHKEYSSWNTLLEGRINSDVLIYGSSRAWVQINPAMITKIFNLSCYNLGIDAHNFWLQNLRHEYVLEKNKQPKFIIHSLDIFTLSKIPNLVNSEQFLPYMLFNNKIKKATISYKGYKTIDYYIPLIRYFGNHESIEESLQMSKNAINKIERINGYQGQNKIWNKDFEIAQKNNPIFEIPFDEGTLELFDKFIKDCKRKNIKLIFVYTPEYIEGQKFVKNRKFIIETFSKISKKYKIPFFDYSNDSISFDKKYFYNALHLNKKGSEIFTKKFVATLEKEKIFK